jgi:hypothetical protein
MFSVSTRILKYLAVEVSIKSFPGESVLWKGCSVYIIKSAYFFSRAVGSSAVEEEEEEVIRMEEEEEREDSDARTITEVVCTR